MALPILRLYVNEHTFTWEKGDRDTFIKSVEDWLYYIDANPAGINLTIQPIWEDAHQIYVNNALRETLGDIYDLIVENEAIGFTGLARDYLAAINDPETIDYPKLPAIHLIGKLNDNYTVAMSNQTYDSYKEVKLEALLGIRDVMCGLASYNHDKLPCYIKAYTVGGIIGIGPTAIILLDVDSELIDIWVVDESVVAYYKDLYVTLQVKTLTEANGFRDIHKFLASNAKGAC